jgi:hypothetical protein
MVSLFFGEPVDSIQVNAPPPRLFNEELARTAEKSGPGKFELEGFENPAANPAELLIIGIGKKVNAQTNNQAVLARIPAQGIHDLDLPGLQAGDFVAVKLSKGSSTAEIAIEKKAAIWSEKISRKIENETLRPEFFVPTRKVPGTNHLVSVFDRNFIPLDVWLQRVKKHYPKGVDELITRKIEDNISDILNEFRRLELVHGDLKPSNLLINPENYDIKMIDFESVAKVGQYPESLDGKRRLTTEMYGSDNSRSNGPAKYLDDEDSFSIIVGLDLEEITKK